MNEGFVILVNGRRLQEEKANGNIIRGLRYKYDAPSGFEPDVTDDETQGFGPGSEIMTVDGDLFKCVSADRGAAEWVQVDTSAISPPS